MNTSPVAIANPGGKAFVLDAQGNPSWRPWAEVSASAPEGHYVYQLGGTGSIVAALGPPPPAGVSSDLYTWRPGKPSVASSGRETRAAQLHLKGKPPGSAADPHGWLASIERVCGTLSQAAPAGTGLSTLGA